MKIRVIFTLALAPPQPRMNISKLRFSTSRLGEISLWSSYEQPTTSGTTAIRGCRQTRCSMAGFAVEPPRQEHSRYGLRHFLEIFKIGGHLWAESNHREAGSRHCVKYRTVGAEDDCFGCALQSLAIFT